MIIQSQLSDLLEIYRLEDSIENKTVSDPELMSVYDTIISITDKYDFNLSPEKKGSGLMENIHSLAIHRASALEKKREMLTRDAEKMRRDGKESQANDLFEECKDLQNQWISANKKAIETIKVH